MTDVFGPLADEAIRDTRMTPAHLIVFAWRSTFADEKSAFGVRVGLVGKLVSGKGLGKNKAQQVLADLTDWGYLSRSQPPADRRGGLVYSQTAIDKVKMPPGPFRQVWRSWFTGQHTLAELAAYLFLIAGTGKGKMTYADEIQKRFKWGREKTDRTMRALVERGLVQMSMPRNTDGTFKGSGFILAAAIDQRAACKPGHRQPGHRIEGNKRKAPHGQENRDALPASQNTRPDDLGNSQKESTLNARAEGAGNYLPLLPSRETRRRALLGNALVDPLLLGWVETDTTASRVAEGVYDEHVAEIEEVYHDPHLRKLVSDAARTRIHPTILTATGLGAVRWLAAAFLSRASGADGGCPKRAMKAVLDAIDHKIGQNKGQRLNSLKLIGKRMMHHLDNYDDATTELYAAQSHNRAA